MTKNIIKKWFKLTIMIGFLPITIIWFIWAKTKMNDFTKIFVTILWIALITVGANSKSNINHNPNNEKNTRKITAVVTSTPTPTPHTNTPTATPTPEVKKVDDNPVSIINNTVEKIGDYEVTIWINESNFAKKDSKPPFEVIVNSSFAKEQSCFQSKDAMFQIMKSLYTNPSLKNKLSRVQFTAPHQLQGSVGADDAKFDWNASGPSNLWKILQQYNPREDQNSPLKRRTFGKRINPNCE